MNLPFARFGYPWMIVWAIIVHLLWGVVLILQPSAASLIILVGLNRFTESGLKAEHLGIILLAASSLALVGLLLESRARPRVCLALLLSQYGLMIAALLSDIEFIIRAINPMTDMHINRVILVVVLGPMIIAAILHTLSILERFVFLPKERA